MEIHLHVKKLNLIEKLLFFFRNLENFFGLSIKNPIENILIYGLKLLLLRLGFFDNTLNKSDENKIPKMSNRGQIERVTYYPFLSLTCF